MAERRGADLYRSRASYWQAEAEKLLEGPEREAYVMLAQGYTDLANLLETVRAAGSTTPSI